LRPPLALVTTTTSRPPAPFLVSYASSTRRGTSASAGCLRQGPGRKGAPRTARRQL